MPRRAAARVALTAALAVALVAALAGCGSVVPGRAVAAPVPSGDLALLHAWVDGLDRAGDVGVDAQTAYLRATQDPDSPPYPPECLDGLTISARIVDRTVRPDVDFVAARAGGAPARPGGAVYVAAIDVAASQNGTAVREIIASTHLVVRGDRVYGYSPCSQ